MNKLERRFYLVDAQVLPEVFLKVVRAKELLASGSCPSTAVGYYRADDLPDVCNYSHGQAAVSSAPLTSEPDTTNLDTD